MPRPGLPLLITGGSPVRKSDTIWSIASHHSATPQILILDITVLPQTREIRTALVVEYRVRESQADSYKRRASVY